MLEKKDVFRLLDEYFKTRKNQFDINQLEEVSILIEKNILISIDGKQVKINIDSILFNEVLLVYIERNQKQKLPQNIQNAFKFIEKFENQTKRDYGYGNTVNTYSTIINGLKSYIFYLFHIKKIINIIDFFKTLNGKERSHYDKYLFDALLLIDTEAQELYNTLAFLKSNNEIIRISEFCSKLAKSKPQLADKLYNHALQNNDKNDFYILSYLLLGMFESEVENTFSKTIKLLEINPSLAYFILGRLEYKQKKHIRICYSIAENADKSDIESLIQVPYVYRSLIENPNTPKVIREKCFIKIQELFLVDNENLRDVIFMYCRFMEGHEEQRYKLLVEDFLSKSENYFKEISDYFHNFTNPDYFFHLFSFLYNIHYQKLIALMNVEIFEKALSHFWKIDRIKTERNLLILLSQDVPHLRIGAVDLIRSKSSGFYDVDIHKLHTEKKQLRALEAIFFQCYYNIDKLLPLILKFKYSIYEHVVTYLIAKLSDLILHSYHDYLYEKINELISDTEFISKVKLSLDRYHKIKEIKSSVNDLSPRKNEHDWMTLYYRLENEEKHKMIHKINNSNDSFLASIKQTTIVRGNAWQTRGNQISPLGHIEHSFSLDMRMYLNPDIFDFTHNNFTSEF